MPNSAPALYELPPTSDVPVDAHIFISTSPREPLPHPGALSGFALAVKDTIDVAGFVTTNGSAHYSHEPAELSAPVVALLENAGAHVVGKTNLDEYAWGVTGDNVAWGRIWNPRYPEHTAGGSSGGTAAAIAAGAARIGLGTDTAGSVRIPAAACGVVGFRPRTGTLSVLGAQQLAPSFDVIGPMAQSVADVRAMWEVLSPSYAAEARSVARPLALGIMEELPAGREFESLGIRTQKIATPHHVLVPFWTIMRWESHQTHRERFAQNPLLFGPAIRKKISTAGMVTAEAAAGARVELSRMREEFDVMLREFDAVLLPSVGRSTPPAGVDEATIRDDFGWPSAMISALDLAAVSIGNLQVAARSEAIALNVASLWEEHIGGFPRP